MTYLQRYKELSFIAWCLTDHRIKCKIMEDYVKVKRAMRKRAA